MGYTTDFNGRLTLDKPLTAAHAAYLRAFNGTRRMRRNAELTAKLPDPVREAAGLPIGEDAEYYVGGASDGQWGQSDTLDVTEHNTPPGEQPSLWCQWTVDPYEEGEPEGLSSIGWDGGEKFYEYVPWLRYVIDRFLKPWGYVANGDIEWSGEESDDRGMIRVTDNRVAIGTPGAYVFGPAE